MRTRSSADPAASARLNARVKARDPKDFMNTVDGEWSLPFYFFFSMPTSGALAEAAPRIAMVWEAFMRRP
jgi:hypothetical protein